jgi:hypothetical protein
MAVLLEQETQDWNHGSIDLSYSDFTLFYMTLPEL